MHTETTEQNLYNSYIGLPFTNHKDRISKTQALEREMLKKHKLNKGQFRISTLGDCVICEWKDRSRLYY